MLFTEYGYDKKEVQDYLTKEGLYISHSACYLTSVIPEGYTEMLTLLSRYTSPRSDHDMSSGTTTSIKLYTNGSTKLSLEQIQMDLFNIHRIPSPLARNKVDEIERYARTATPRDGRRISLYLRVDKLGDDPIVKFELTAMPEYRYKFDFLEYEEEGVKLSNVPAMLALRLPQYQAYIDLANKTYLEDTKGLDCITTISDEGKFIVIIEEQYNRVFWGEFDTPEEATAGHDNFYKERQHAKTLVDIFLRNFKDSDNPKAVLLTELRARGEAYPTSMQKIAKDTGLDLDLLWSTLKG